MSNPVRNIAILGSTGSVGRSTLDVIAASPNRLRAVGLTAHRSLSLLVDQARQLRPRWIVATDPVQAECFDWSALPPETMLLVGPDGLHELVTQPEVDVVVAAIVGIAGLRGTWSAVAAGKTVALANKEPLVVGGSLVMQLARQHRATILPVDSEHSAVFQALKSGRPSEVRRIILTASGGPFRECTQAELEQVTVQQALAHPTWNMGPKITVDSATMMNKALEMVEARWLFDLPAEKIDVVIHPQSIIHSLVEFHDGAVIGQLSPPDMKLPIQYALTYPDRVSGPAPRLDLSQTIRLQLEPPDLDRFPALALGKQVARSGGTAGAVLSAANEAAVAQFLAGRLKFSGIVAACRSILNYHDYDSAPSLERLLQLDAWARAEVTRWIGT